MIPWATSETAGAKFCEYPGHRTNQLAVYAVHRPNGSCMLTCERHFHTAMSGFGFSEPCQVYCSPRGMWKSIHI